MVGEKDKSVNIYKREYTSGRSGRERNPSRTDSSSSSDSARGGDSGSGSANGSAPTLDLTIPMLPTMRRHLTGGTLRQDQDFGSADEETKCNQCDKTFAKNSNLKTHIRRFHKDPENIFKCNKAGCKAAFKHRWDNFPSKEKVITLRSVSLYLPASTYNEIWWNFIEIKESAGKELDRYALIAPVVTVSDLFSHITHRERLHQSATLDTAALPYIDFWVCSTVRFFKPFDQIINWCIKPSDANVTQSWSHYI